MNHGTRDIEVGENPLSFDENPDKNYKALLIIMSIIILDFLKNIAELVVSSMIVKNEPEFYENSWKVQAAVITTIMVSVISTLTEVISIIVIPFLKSSQESGKLSEKGSGCIVFAAQIFSMVCTYVAWKEMWDHPLGKVFCILAGIVQPAIFFIVFILVFVFCCCLIMIEE